MNLLKSVGLAAYYRIRRISKAVKNWKKFGVIMFGSLFLASSVLPINVLAQSNNLLRVALVPGSSTIELGGSKTFKSEVQYNGSKITPTTIAWFVDNKEQTSAYNSANLTLSPELAGEYTIRAIATYNNLTAQSYAVLNVTASTNGGGQTEDNNSGSEQTAGLLRAAIIPGSSTVKTGVVKSFRLESQLDGQLTSPDTINWFVDDVEKTAFKNKSVIDLSSDTAKVFKIRAVITKSGKVAQAYSNLTVEAGVTPPSNEQKLLRVAIIPGSSEIYTDQSKTFRAEVQLNGQLLSTPDSLKWYVDGVHQTNNDGQFTLPMVNKPAKVYNLRIEATESGANNAFSVATLTVKERPNPVCTVFSITPDSVTKTLVNGVATQSFSLVAEDAVGNSVTPTNVVWSVNGVGSIAPTGATTALWTGRTTGSAMVSVSGLCNGSAFVDSAPITVITTPNRVLLNVAITPDMPSVLSGTNVTYHATAYDTNGAIIDPATEPVSFNWMLIGTGPSLGQLLSTTGENVVFKSNPGLQGNYYNFVKVTATYKGLVAADTEGASLYQVVTQNNLSYVKMTVDRDPIYTFDSTPVRAQAYDNFNNPIANCAYNWVEISGPGSITSAANQQVITYGSNSLTGLANLQVTASCLGESKFTTGTVTVIAVGNDYRVEITPKVGYGVVDSDIYYNVRAYYNGTDVTNASNFNWAITGNAGGYLKDGVGTDAIIHAGNIAGTYNNVLSVTGTYNGLSDYDNASMVVTATVPNYDITTSFNGSLDSRGTAVCTDDVITYVLSVANMQNSVLHNVNVTMPIPANTRFVSATSAGNSPTLNGNNIYWNVGSLALGETKVMTVRVSALETLTGNRTVTATATVNGSEIASRTITANPINLICVTGKGPLPNTGVEWQMLLALISGALGLAGMTYMMMRRRNMYV